MSRGTDTQSDQPVKDRMTYQEYAAYRGIAVANIYQMKAKKRLRMKNGRIDVIETDKVLDEEDNESILPGPADDGHPSVGIYSKRDAETRKVNFQAQLCEMEVLQKQGKLIDAEAARNAMFDQWRTERDALMNWPSRVSPIIAAKFKIDPTEFLIELEKHVRKYLDDRSKTPS